MESINVITVMLALMCLMSTCIEKTSAQSQDCSGTMGCMAEIEV